MNKSNLAYEAPDPQGQVVQFPKKERQVMSDKDEGFTPLPNLICDEGYLAALDGDSIKCLILLNRHIKGFHIEKKSIGESLVMKITGIKDKRTVRKRMAELESFGLVKIIKSNGVSNSYEVTFEDRKPVKPVTCRVTGSGDKDDVHHMPPVAPHVTRPVAPHVTATSSTACHSVKEIDLKENIKEREEEEAHGENQKFTAQKRQLSFVEYHVSDRTPISLRDLFRKYPAQVDFVDQAKVSFPDHSDQQIFDELRKLGQWSMSASNHMPQKWMSIWLNWMQKIPTATEQAAAAKRKSTSTAKPQTNGRRDFIGAAKRMMENKNV